METRGGRWTLPVANAIGILLPNIALGTEHRLEDRILSSRMRWSIMYFNPRVVVVIQWQPLATEILLGGVNFSGLGDHGGAERLIELLDTQANSTPYPTMEVLL